MVIALFVVISIISRKKVLRRCLKISLKNYEKGGSRGPLLASRLIVRNLSEQ